MTGNNIDKNSLLYKVGDGFLGKSIRNFLDKQLLGEKNKTLIYINLWSIMHLFSGILVYSFITTDIYQAIVIHTIFELWQIYIGMTNVDIYGITDSFVDTLFFILGFYIAKRLFIKYNIKMFN
jgi:hypothetical protein